MYLCGFSLNPLYLKQVSRDPLNNFYSIFLVLLGSLLGSLRETE